MSENLRDQFLLRPDVAFLNHGSFGACPVSVFDTYVSLLREIESEPVEFIARRSQALYKQARTVAGAYMNVDADDLVFVTNATVGCNIVAHSLKLGAGDEVLTIDHEYGACDRMWSELAIKYGFTYRAVTIPVPVTTHEDLIERLFAAVSASTRVIFISHITSPTAITIPVDEICRKARELGITTLVDGAHAPGQIDLDIRATQADYYTGNLHKWLCGPKGSAFLYARRELQNNLEPLVISWGSRMMSSGSQFIDDHQFRGTRDVAAPLVVETAIEFQRDNDWDTVRQSCHELVRRARPLIADALNAPPTCPDDDVWYAQMASFVLPKNIDGELLQRLLFDEHLVEIPVMPWNDAQVIRISIQGYNNWNDVERLLDGISSVKDRCLR